ncbi:hypothetical protein M6B38_390155 [Iris pallida]|uniref:Uncharacterized protein n=1 Tax=Iris pallida TaxID=29817 RepID=A0AAX6G0U5_IRIPA|nr:hypothetical protein M6B38_390155 [Iris pallida]
MAATTLRRSGVIHQRRQQRSPFPWTTIDAQEISGSSHSIHGGTTTSSSGDESFPPPKSKGRSLLRRHVDVIGGCLYHFDTGSLQAVQRSSAYSSLFD